MKIETLPRHETQSEAVKSKEGRAIGLRQLLLCLLAAILLAAILAAVEKIAGRPIGCLGPGCPPPCDPPQVGDWPDCHDPK